MTDRVILDVSGHALDELGRALSTGEAAELLARLDTAPVAAVSLGLGAGSRDLASTAMLATFLLGRTRALGVVITVDWQRQHPVNIARTAATLSALSRGRVGIAARERQAPTPPAHWEHPDGATAAAYLDLLSQLWESWPLDAVVGDAETGRYVDDSRIVRVRHEVYQQVGGPLTLPTDTRAKPPLLLVGDSGSPSDRVDAALRRESGPGSAGDLCRDGRIVLRAGLASLADLLVVAESSPAEAAGTPAATLRERLGLPASTPSTARTSEVFASGRGQLLL